MTEVAKIHQDELVNLKKCVKNAYLFFEPNYKRFNEFRRFVFDTSLTDSDNMVLDALKKPKIEFNICEAYISRLRGEFSKQQPSIVVMAEDGAKVDPKTIDVVEAHMRHLIFEANKNGTEYDVYTDMLSGGYSVMKVSTEYANPMSFDQIIKIQRAYDPTLCGFDPLARESHKGDGRFCFELFPISKEEFEQMYPGIDLKQVNFSRALQGFNWSYSNNQEDILLICDFYKKKKKRKKIVRLVNGHTMTVDDYKEFLVKWEEAGIIAAPPGIKGKPRWTEIEMICRYRFIETQMLEYVETDFKHLPLVFADGNSVILRNGNSGAFTQMTRPYIYHAKGMQQLKNFAGQSLANELENLVQHKFMVAKEALPDEQSYLDAYTNIQIANTLVFKAFKDNDPNIPIMNPIREVNRIPIPPEVTNSFTLADQLAQSILGSYDASLGINDNQLSGTAIVEGATQSNSAAMPYIVGFMQAWSQVANICVELFPLYYVTPRTLPIVNSDGSRSYQQINQQNAPSFNYDENVLQVKIEAGVNFSVQKSRALNQIIQMTQASPMFAAFINAKGLKIILDNFEINGIDELKFLADQWMEEQAQQQKMQQQMQQQQMQNNPLMLKAQNERMKIAEESKKAEANHEIEIARVQIDKQEADTNFLKVMADMHEAKIQQSIAIDKADAEKARAAADMAMEHHDMRHNHMMDVANFHHEVKQANKEKSHEKAK